MLNCYVVYPKLLYHSVAMIFIFKKLKGNKGEVIAEEGQSFLSLRSSVLQKGRLGLQQHPYHKHNGSLVSRILRVFWMHDEVEQLRRSSSRAKTATRLPGFLCRLPLGTIQEHCSWHAWFWYKLGSQQFQITFFGKGLECSYSVL